MQIKSTHLAARTSLAAHTQGTQPKQTREEQVLRPLNEQWTVGDDTYDSTAELLGKGGEISRADATYTYVSQEAPAPFSKTEKAKNAVGAGIAGAAVGAVGGAFVGGGLTLLGTAGEILNGFMGGRMDGVSAALMFGPIAIGGVIGAVAGGIMGYKGEPIAQGGQVQGVLQNSGQGLAFYPQGQVDQKVDLASYQNAPTPEITQAQAPESKPLKNALLGAGAAVATLPAQFIPFGLFAPPVVGSKIGAAMDKRTALGEGLGLLAGTALTGGAIYTLNHAINGGGGWPIALAAAGGLAVGGALLGDKVITAMNTVEARRDYGQQWWNKG